MGHRSRSPSAPGGTQQHVPFGLRKTRSGPAQGTFLAEQPGEKLLRGQERPQRVEGLADRVLVPQPRADVGHVLGVKAAPEHLGLGRGQRVEHLGDEQLAGDVVRPPHAAGLDPGALADVGRHAHRHAVDADLQVSLRYPLPVPDRGAQDPDHPQVALEDGGFRGVLGGRADAGEQLAQRGHHHVGLAQRREHLADVAQEGGVRADDEHAAPLQRLAVRVQQVRRTVQRGHGLAGAGAALDDQDAGQRGTDHPVLLGLDGGDHVAHPPGTAAPDRGQQHGLADQPPPVGFAHAVEVEYLVIQAHDGAAAGIEMPPAEQAGRVVRRGRVKRACGRGPPVDKNRLVLVIVQPDPADIKGAVIGVVHPAEAQATLDAIQLGKPSGLLSGGDFALEAGGEGTARTAATVYFTQGCVAPLARRIQQPVEHGNVILLVPNGLRKSRLSLTIRHIRCYTLAQFS